MKSSNIELSIESLINCFFSQFSTAIVESLALDD